jgi:2-polyprenyl-3-methyl-5-hydroxy-6-metoxy-1,4-benzoquinol methylase
MSARVKTHYDKHPDPALETSPVGPSQLDRIDENLHFGWSWHRYRFCYRPSERLKILDAGCGTGISTLSLARLNSGSSVLGIDFSESSLEVARSRAALHPDLQVEFRALDFEAPLPGAVGTFDFVLCRNVLAQVDDPGQVLKNLAARLDSRGLLLATFPSRGGRHPAFQMRRSIRALAEPGAPVEELAQIGVALFRALRSDHPIRWYEALLSGPGLPGPERVIAGYLNEPERTWTLEEAVALVQAAGLQFLHAPLRQPWVPDRALVQSEISSELKQRVERATELGRSVLIDALDPSLHGDNYRVYACLAEFEPRLPGWPETCQRDPAAIEALIPHRTGLAWPDRAGASPAASRGGVQYRAVSGGVGEFPERSHALLEAADGSRTCGEIQASLVGPPEAPASFRDRWLDLANRGLVLLESPDPRQHVDCQHLGPVRDRLDCPCPRKWIRACELHGSCTIDTIASGDPQHAPLQDALRRLGLAGVVACDRCPDYIPED